MTYKKLLFTGLFALCSVVSNTALAQDLMARQANMDKQLKAIDSVSLQRSIHKEASQMVSNLYNNWTHDRVDAYRDMPKPSYYKIDLRDFTMPTPSRIVTSNFGYRPRFRRKHYGIDVKLYTGDTVVAAFSGKIRIVDYDRGGFGYYVVIRHANGLETLYGHLSKQLVEQDQYVKSGQPIGLGGNTGHSFGSHLHFETRLLGEAIDPALMFDFANQDVTGDYYVYRNENAFYAKNDNVDNSQADNTTALIHNANLPINSEESNENSHATSEKKISYHKVSKGDTLYSIATSCGLTVKQLCQLNGLKTKSKLRIGQILKCQ